MIAIQPGKRTGSVKIPRSKSHEHRLLVADFLAGDYSRLAPAEGDSEDILATKRCLEALKGDGQLAVLDCGESGSTRRFLGPVAAALGKSVTFLTRGRLSERPQMDYSGLKSGLHELAGDVSSQFVTGLLFALPILEGDSQIRFTTPLESRGYVDMTLRVLSGAGIYVAVRDDGFDVPGGQKYVPQPDVSVELDWSGAAFWYAMNAMGSLVMFDGRGRGACAAHRRRVEGRGGRSVRLGLPRSFPGARCARGRVGGRDALLRDASPAAQGVGPRLCDGRRPQAFRRRFRGGGRRFHRPRRRRQVLGRRVPRVRRPPDSDGDRRRRHDRRFASGDRQPRMRGEVVPRLLRGVRETSRNVTVFAKKKKKKMV